jgi:putative endonuclease
MQAKLNIGRLGEEIAVRFLARKGFTIRSRNYRKHHIGEIDIIAEHQDVIRIVEVKTFSRETGEYQPEENVHPLKLRKILRTAEFYAVENSLEEREFQIDVLAIRLDTTNKRAYCKFLENV